MSVQAGLFDSVLPDRIQRSLEMGAKIVKRSKDSVGMILCPSCHSEKDLRLVFENGQIVAHRCLCGCKFTNDEAEVLTFQNSKEG